MPKILLVSKKRGSGIKNCGGKATTIKNCGGKATTINLKTTNNYVINNFLTEIILIKKRKALLMSTMLFQNCRTQD